MKVVILAGGLGTRLGEETTTRPKPMVDIGGKPILWHIMKYYSHFGLNEFVICLGYKGYVIKEYFSNYFLHTSDVTIDLRYNSTTIHNNTAEPWQITLVETGESTMTGGRLKRVRPYLGEGDFCMTYGDGLSNVDITALLKFHASHGKLATVTAVTPAARFGAMVIEEDAVSRFEEKPVNVNDSINGGFFVLSPRALDHVGDDSTVWEREPMERLASEGELMAFRHSGFWQPMDMLRDKLHLEELWAKGQAPWKKW
ncbi:glucose-1-phosphate cytidylyltransferase [Methylobacterium sp. J-076]|uniref:glucose-1-phosphate cytidylyltransferase n=1 Tax=Methylobacterium sp. J-076 TaxID=2836655 RepID=UPI001FBB3265|nr:glucose-1-phosphate cytidylyltransferase [Methylobacterium sp. J-076]MCJ2011962.1 glucose-1-phosphate cytidylyltransferase [Methylobacterium sp. J-076]